MLLLTKLKNLRRLLPGLLLLLVVSALYGQFLWNPVVFDDENFFDGKIHAQYLGKLFSFDLRWLPYATFEWTRELLGLELIWLRLGNMAIHIACVTVLFLFLRRLFEVVMVEPDDSVAHALKPSWLAFFAALIFALHPASVYAVAYLIQRSILMATLFSLIMWWLFLEGSIRRRPLLLIASAAAYFFAVLSKEHAIMAPAVALALLLLTQKPTRQLFMRIWPIFILYGAVGLFVVIQIKASHILGSAYEPNANDMLSRLGALDGAFDPRYAYPLSILTQSLLFFKYLLVWIVPSSAWMSVDMYEPFAANFWSWPHLLGFLGFIIFPVVAVRLLLKRGPIGLFGFAMLCPWLLFATELSTIRIQESFVLYRSYLWMAVAFAALPLLFRKIPAKRAVIILMAIALLMAPLSWVRLKTFSHSILLWDDAARLVKGKDKRMGVERIYHNRGATLLIVGLQQDAIDDLNKAIAINPGNAYSYSARGTAYLETRNYPQALSDFTQSIGLFPEYSQPYLGRARVYEALANMEAARQDYKDSCARGAIKACDKLKSLESSH